ncbi:MAG: signal recognition particle protein [Dehalococcoidia bacterium]
MFEALTDKLQGVFHRLGSRGTVSERDLEEALREVRLALLEADVHFRVVRDFVGRVRQEALGQEVLRSLTPAQQVLTIVHGEVVHLLGDGQSRLAMASQPPTVLLLVGLKGSGKTTTAAKLGLHLRRSGQRPLLVAADPQRVAAAEQLVALGRSLEIPVYSEEGSRRPTDIARHALAEGRRLGANAVVVDTMGYTQFGEEGLADLGSLRDALSPQEVLLVADAMTGQEAVQAAEEFHRAVALTGLVLTKLDGDARGGAALSIRAVTGIPIKFVGTGEKPDALEPFHPDRFASRILGMGDILTLAERAREAVAETEAQELARKARRGTLTLEDFQEQLRRVQKMGPLNQVLQMIPGVATARNRAALEAIDEGVLRKAEAIICSMTPVERQRPEVIDGSRRRRIARGSGTAPHDVNQLLKQYQEAKRLMQMVSSGRGSKVPPQWLQRM